MLAEILMCSALFYGESNKPYEFKCMSASNDVALNAALSCNLDPVVSCSARWGKLSNGRQYVVFVYRRLDNV